MGTDASIVFVPAAVSADALVATAERAFADDGPEDLALLYTSKPERPECLRRCFPRYVPVSLWADREEGLARFTRELSARLKQTLVVLTVADHSCVGGYQVYHNGKRGPSGWREGEGHTEYSITGVEVAFGVKLDPIGDEKLFLTDHLLEHDSGVCIFSSRPWARPRQPLPGPLLRAIMGNDLAGIDLECLLLLEET